MISILSPVMYESMTFDFVFMWHFLLLNYCYFLRGGQMRFLQLITTGCVFPILAAKRKLENVNTKYSFKIRKFH